MDIKKLREGYETMLNFYKQLSDQVADQFMYDVLFFLTYLAGADKKFNQKESKYIQDILSLEIKDLPKIYKDFCKEVYSSSIPVSLQLALLSDQDRHLDFDDGISKQYFSLIAKLGTALLEVDGKTELENNAFVKYMFFLEQHCIETLKPKTQGSSKKKIEAVPKKDATPAKAETKQKQQANTEEAKDGGEWIKASEHKNTGNFLDDLFRHTALSHEQRVHLWGNLIGPSIPSIWMKDLEPLRAGVVLNDDWDTSPINVLYELINSKPNKPVFYYASLLHLKHPNSKKFIQGGILVYHGGIMLVFHDVIDPVSWDDIKSVQVKDDKSQNHIVFSSKPYKKDSRTIEARFPKSSNNPSLLQEVQFLKSLCEIRISQIDAFRESSQREENPRFYLVLNNDNDEDDTVCSYRKLEKLCVDYILEQNHPVTQRDSTSEPSLLTKSTDSKVRIKPEADNTRKNSGSKRNQGSVKIDLQGPTTMLAFWQALKPFLAQIRHLEFDKTVIKETDSHNAKPTIITGVYNSILIRRTQRILRLELYINTETEAGNLQILDHIRKNMKIPSALKDQVQFNRKEGRLAQRIFVNFEGFDLSDRSCWAKYIELITSVADDFFDALEEPMRDLISKDNEQKLMPSDKAQSKQSMVSASPASKEQDKKKDISPQGMVFVEGGTFTMGSRKGASDEKPEHQVSVSSFYISKYQITQKDWETLMGDNPVNNFIAKTGDVGYGTGDNHPIYFINWLEAIAYCNRRSLKEGLSPCYSYGTYGTDSVNWPSGWNKVHVNDVNVKCAWKANGYRLPSEAEWEFAARGGNQSKGYRFCGSDDLYSVAWHVEWDSDHKTHPIGLKQPNELGIYDMSGNVSEWCWDKYGNYTSEPQKDPHGPANGEHRSFRGGSFIMYSDKASVSGRDYNGAAQCESDYGLRVCRSRK